MIKDIAFGLDAGRVGVLLVHGLTGTPNEMRHVAVGLHRASLTVSAMQLAGHCGNAEDLLNSRWPDWFQSVRDAADRLRERVDHLFIAGLSMGGILALNLAAEQPLRVDGVIVYGASFRYDGWSVPWSSRLLSRLLPLARPLRVGRGRTFLERPPYGIRDERLREAILALMNSGDSTQAGLRGNPWYSLADMYALSNVVRRRLHKVKSPCLVVHAAEDDVASVKNARLIVNRVRGPVELILLHDSYHMVTIDRERATVIERTVAFVRRVVAQATRHVQPLTAGIDANERADAVQAAS